MIKRRGTIYWLDTRVDGQRLRRSLGTTDKEQAKRMAPQALADMLLETTGSTGEGLSLSEGFQRLMEEEWNKTKDRKMLETRIKEIEGILGAATPLADVKRPELIHLQATLSGCSGRAVGSTASPAAVNRKMAVIIRLLNVAYSHWEVIAGVPRVRPLSVAKLKMRGITEAEIPLLMKHTAPYMHDVWKFLIETGMRVGEWQQLHWRHVNFEGGFINLQPSEVMELKSHAERSIPMSQTVRTMLRNRRKQGLIRPFCDIGREAIRYQWNLARKAMKMENDIGFVPHSLRHTCATRLIDKGVPTSTVQKWLGHSSITTTEKYIQQSPESLKQYVGLVEVK